MICKLRLKQTGSLVDTQVNVTGRLVLRKIGWLALRLADREMPAIRLVLVADEHLSVIMFFLSTAMRMPCFFTNNIT